MKCLEIWDLSPLDKRRSFAVRSQVTLLLDEPAAGEAAWGAAPTWLQAAGRCSCKEWDQDHCPAQLQPMVLAGGEPSTSKKRIWAVYLVNCVWPVSSHYCCLFDLPA